MASNPIRHKRDQLKQYRAFCAAAGFENMTKAAEQLGVTQRAIALQVRSLEYELETELFERDGPRLRLTEAGRRLQGLAQPLVDELDSLADTFAEKRSELASANIEVAVAPVASVAMPAFVARFLGKHPRAHIRVTSCAVRDGLPHLAEGGRRPGDRDGCGRHGLRLPVSLSLRTDARCVGGASACRATGSTP